MSLVQSLFGTASEADPSNNDTPKEQVETNDLFSKTVEVPEPQVVATVQPKPQHRPPKQRLTVPRDESADERTIFVGNLPLSFTKKRRRLQSLFSKFGKIESVRIRNVATKGIKLPNVQKGNQNLVKQVASNTNQLLENSKQSVSGYVVFAEPSSVEAALSMNHSLVTDGTVERHIRVDRCQATHDASRTVFVGNLPYQADEETLGQHFANVLDSDETKDSVENVRIVRDKETYQCQGFAYVLLANTALRAQALQNANQTEYMGRPLRVQVCGTKYNSKDKKTKKKENQHETDDHKTKPVNVAGAVRRILHSPPKSQTKKRLRGRHKKTATATGTSKRAAKQAKSTKRLKKLERRLQKGMGKTKKP